MKCILCLFFIVEEEKKFGAYTNDKIKFGSNNIWFRFYLNVEPNVHYFLKINCDFRIFQEF